ncbi:hypothetical protein NDU88_002862 [Pleurodeles waltl]|uniref:Endonuclease/exonuclease/phosphatase domain-containing protein n=1 Tax=Pleurodeles waltl TaxID=8319 RepID=A0AAV7P7U9_PLEWA|nr:hypothetical protein NDU88_002862 [Pleurodeles waltl]
MRSGRLRLSTKGKVKTSRPQRRAQRKVNCSAQSPQSSRPDQQVSPLTPLQVYLKKTGVSNKFAFLKDPAAAFFSNLDTDVGLPTPLVPQPMPTGQLRLEVSTNPTQQLGVDLPFQEAPKRLAPKVHNDHSAHERLNISRVASSPTVRKNLQAGSIVTTARVHVQERESPQSDQQQGASINLSNTKPLLPTGFSIEVHNDIMHEGMRQQSTPIPRSNLNAQGSNGRLDMCFEVATGIMEDSWLQSLSITNNKDLGEALDLKTLDLMNPKDQYLNKPLLVGSTKYSSSIPQQERPPNSIMEISSGISKLQHDVEAMVRSSLTISPLETVNREEQLAFSKTDLQAIKINFSNNRHAPLVIFHVYAHPRKIRKVLLFDELLNKVEEIRCANPAWDILVTGDFNANLMHTPEPDEQLAAENAIWSVPLQILPAQKRLDTRGKQLVEALEHMSMRVLNGRINDDVPPSFTHHSAKSATIL